MACSPGCGPRPSARGIPHGFECCRSSRPRSGSSAKRPWSLSPPPATEASTSSSRPRSDDGVSPSARATTTAASPWRRMLTLASRPSRGTGIR
jgi:hypothetical protein